MICPHIINVSVLMGGMLTWGIMWHLIEKKKGDWYPADLKANNLHGLQGYKVFIATAVILGDGLYNFFKVLSHTISGLLHEVREKHPLLLPISRQTYGGPSTSSTPSLVAQSVASTTKNAALNYFSKIKYQHVL